MASANLGAQPAQSAYNPLPAVSTYLNEELPSWLRIGGEFRARLEGFTGGGGFKKDTTDDYLLTCTRINLTIEPAHWLRIFVQGQDSHALWKNQHPEAPPFQSTMNLRQAYLELGNTTKGPIGFRVGRQASTTSFQIPLLSLTCCGACSAICTPKLESRATWVTK